MIIKFKKWDKYNIRRGDIKFPGWFAFDHGFFSDSKLYELNSDELLTLIYLLCEASKTNQCGTAVISPQHHRVHCRVQSREPNRVLNRTIEKCYKLQIIEQPRVRGAYANLGDMALTDNTDNTDRQTILPDSANAEPRRFFDFDALYKKYPRKEGKHRGMLVCKTQIKSQEDLDSLSLAIDRYVAHIKKTTMDPKFIKHFSTFMNSWRDWLDPQTGSVDKPKPDYSYLED